MCDDNDFIKLFCKNIEMLTGRRGSHILRDEKMASLKDMEELVYDKEPLFLAETWPPIIEM